MKKQSLYLKALVLILAICGMASGLAIAANTLTVPDAAITIEGKKPATFTHSTHTTLGVACATCHHDSEHKPLNAGAISKLEDGTKLQCITCHNSEFAKPELQKAKDVFHARCKECHKTGVDGKKGPTGCSSCHIKKKKKAVEGC